MATTALDNANGLEAGQKTQPQPNKPAQQHVAYPPPAPQNVTTTVIRQPVVVPLTTHIHYAYGSTPMNMTCPYCQAQIVTRTTFQPGILTWLLCGGLAAVGCFFGCCLVPFCINEVKDCTHTCPNCKNFLGVYRHI